MQYSNKALTKRRISFALGLILGIVMGLAFGNIALWSCVGVVFGFAFMRMQDN